MKKYFCFILFLFLGLLLVACQTSEPESISEFNLEDITFSIIEESVEIGSSFIMATLTNHSNRDISYGRTTRVEQWSEENNEWISIYEIDRTFDLALLWVVLKVSESIETDAPSIPISIMEPGLYRLTFEIDISVYDPDSQLATSEIVEIYTEFNVQ